MASRQHGGGAIAPAATDGLTVIGEGINVNGQIHGEEDLRIEGRVEGSISLTETVHVAASGVVVATIEARDVVVSGVVVGNISASNSVSLDPGAKLVGDINAPRVIIADGAAFRGNVTMGEGASTAPPARARASSSRGSAGRARKSSSASASQTKAQSRATPAAKTSGRSTARAEASAPRVAAIRPPKAGGEADDVTVIVRHSEISESEQASSTPKTTTKTTTRAANKKKAKKAPPRGRVPKPGKRRVNRR